VAFKGEIRPMALKPVTDTIPSRDMTGQIADLWRVAADDPPGAMRLALRAKAQGVTHPLVHHLVGLHLKQAGRFEEAIVEMGLGLELEPQNPRLMITVGFCLLELDRRQEAAQVFGVAMRLAPTSAEAAYGYGWAAEQLGALEQAKSAWERAIGLDPNHADALAGLSGLAVRGRDWTAARRWAERAAALDVLQTDAPMNLARVEIGLSDFEAAERRLRDIIALPHLKALARANARIMLGDALDGQKRYAEAFAAYKAGKDELRALHADVFERPGAGTAVDGVGRILAEFRATPPHAWSNLEPLSGWREHRGHAFLLGFPRSGTTLLEQILATHPDVVTLEERPALLKAEAEFLAPYGGITRLAGVVSDLLEPFRDDYWRRVRGFGVEPRGKVFVDKQPLNTFRLPLISKIFPDAKIIFAIRDPRDVVLSCFRRSFNMNASMYQFNSLENAARYYAAIMEAGEAYFDTLPVEVFQIRYESLVRDFTATGSALCDFLEVEWTERLKDFADTAAARMIATPSSTQVGRGLYDDGIDQWRRYASALGPALPILQPWIDKFGYAPA
jgi:tetratricopeptide (TPR) repeat protein